MWSDISVALKDTYPSIHNITTSPSKTKTTFLDLPKGIGDSWYLTDSLIKCLMSNGHKNTTTSNKEKE
jgi:hypothetical protein